jgi:hypothetical protein
VDGTTARAPRSHVCDASTAGRLARVATFALSPSRWVALLFLCAGLGVTYTNLFTWVAGLVVAALMLGGAVWLRFVLLRKTMRTAAAPGTVMTSGYDPQGRFVTVSGQGATGLERGSVSSWSRSDGVVVLRLRRRAIRLFVPAALVDDQDLAFLTDHDAADLAPWTAPAADAAVPATPDLMPHRLTVSEQDQASVSRAVVCMWLARRATWLLLTVDALGLALGLALRSWLLVGITIVAVALCSRAPWLLRRTMRELYPVGSEVRAGVTDDALLLRTVVTTEKVLFTSIGSAVEGPDATDVQLRDKRHIFLPARLLPPADVARLAARSAVGVSQS